MVRASARDAARVGLGLGKALGLWGGNWVRAETQSTRCNGKDLIKAGVEAECADRLGVGCLL